MRDQLLDIVDRLVRIERSLGRAAFLSACHQARLGIGKAALTRAEAEANRVRTPKKAKLTKAPQPDS